MEFPLHSTLANDTHLLFQDAEARLLLHKNAILPWLILVPHTTETEMCALPPELYQRTLERCRVLSLWMQQKYQCDKVNFGAIGNMVPQMHLHMVARFKGDACWPKPVWGNLTEEREYSATDIEAITSSVCSILT